MSDDADFLSQAFSIISGRSADIEGKIERLNRAKQKIINEQSSCMNEIRHIQNPTLDALWSGNRANTFNDSRDEAYQTMQGIINNYDDYIRTIDWEITQLNIQKGSLDIASSIAYQADRLLDKGEEAMSELGQKISQLKGRLF